MNEYVKVLHFSKLQFLLSKLGASHPYHRDIVSLADMA